MLTIDAFQQQLRRIANRADLRINIYNHLFRYSRINYLRWTLGWEIEEIQDFIGHEKIETTRGYLKVNKQKIKNRFLEDGVDEAKAFKERQKVIDEAKAKQRYTICKTCKYENNAGAEWCSNCGNAVSDKALLNKKQEEARYQKQIDSMNAQIDKLTELVMNNA